MSGAPTVLLGFAESLAAIESAWSLQDAGWSVVAFTRAGRRPPLRFDPGVRICEVTAPERDAEACAAQVESLASAVGAALIMALDDLAIWIVARSEGTAVAAPRREQARVALDKRLQLDVARAAGFAVPATWTGPAAEVQTAARSILPWPVVARPALAAREVEGRLERAPGAVCATAGELADLVKRLRPDEPLLVQRWIPGTGEGLVGLATASGPVAVSAHRRIRMLNPRGSGSSACAAAPVRCEDLQSAAGLLDAITWRGLFMVELLRDRDGTGWFVELNGRPWGSTALARRRGLEYPAWAAAHAVDPARAPVARAVAGADTTRARHLGRDLRHLVAVVREPRPPAPLPAPGRLRTARAVLDPRAGRLYNHRRGRTRVLLSDTFQSLRP